MSADSTTQATEQPVVGVSGPEQDHGAPAGELQESGEGAAQVEGESGLEQEPSKVADVQDDFLPRSVLDHEIRKVQSAKDREIAELKRQLSDRAQAQEHRQETPVQTGQQEQAFEQAKFDQLFEEDPTKALMYMRQSAVQEAVQKIKSESMAQQQIQSRLSEYEVNFVNLAKQNSLTQEQMNRAAEVVYGSMVDGLPQISPFEAIAIGITGDPSKALQYATQYLQSNAGQRQAVAQPQTQPMQGQTPPMMPGGRANVPSQPQGGAQGAGSQASFRDWH